MLIGVPREVKDQEKRVGMTPAMVQLLVEAGHRVRIETQAGIHVGFTDENYTNAGAEIASSPEEVYESEMVVKVKEPQSSEFPLLKEGQILFCFLHLAAEPEVTKALIEQKTIAIAFETVTDEKGHLPLLIPMSEIAGRISVQVGATVLQMNHGGKGVLLGGVPGVERAKVVVLGGGVVGTEAARMAMGLGAQVIVLDRSVKRLKELDHLYAPTLNTLYSTPESVTQAVKEADLVIGSVLIPGKRAPKLVTRELIRSMEKGSVFVDVAIDQGGCSDTSKPTSHTNPTYVVDDVVHYCVTNMPGACARTSTKALANATTNYVLTLANKGYRQALLDSKGLRDGLNTYHGEVTYAPVAEEFSYAYKPPEEIL